jgi:hypothetical protein
MKKVIIILDALKDTSVFYKNHLFNNYYKSTILPPFSFEPDAAYLTGYSPEDTDSGTMYWFDPPTSKFNGVPFLRFLPERPSFVKKIGKRYVSITLRLLNKISNDEKENLGMIPFNVLPNFSLSHDMNLFNPSVKFKYETIFNKLKKKNKKYTYLGIPFTSGNLEFIKNNLTDELLLKNDILFLYISDLDHIGHTYGGSSDKYEIKLNEIIKYISFIKNKFDINNLSADFLIFGDHGMVDVKQVIDIEEILSKLPLKKERDYTYFLDSTLARFWYKNEKVKGIINNSLRNDKFGSWINSNDRRKYQINYNHNKFGDDIWWASGGTLISPNFWQGKDFIKGMHGYRNEVVENNTMILSDLKFNVSKDRISMMEVHKVLLDFLEIN